MSSGSSILTNLVPSLNGENYTLFSQQFEAYLMQQGQFSVMEEFLELDNKSTFTVAGVSVTAPDGSTSSTTASITEKCIDHEDYNERLTKNYISTMSSGSSILTNLVLTLNGKNYTLFSQQFEAYLMQQGQFSVIEDFLEVKEGDTFVESTTAGTTSPGGVHTTPATTLNTVMLEPDDFYGRLNHKYVRYLKTDADWKAKDSQVRGALLLRCIPAISNKLREENCAFDMWIYLKKTYGTSGTASVYNVFLQFLYATIPSKGNPLQAIERIDQHVRRMAELDVEIPQFIHAMVLLSKLPAYMKFVQQLSQDKELNNMDPDEI
ncbi:unnamed protein product, partial [Peniophora sp. CBMAI 1063]